VLVPVPVLLAPAPLLLLPSLLPPLPIPLVLLPPLSLMRSREPSSHAAGRAARHSSTA